MLIKWFGKKLKRKNVELKSHLLEETEISFGLRAPITMLERRNRRGQFSQRVDGSAALLENTDQMPDHETTRR